LRNHKLSFERTRRAPERQTGLADGTQIAESAIHCETLRKPGIFDGRSFTASELRTNHESDESRESERAIA
jgi:hypothetical protein